MMALATQRARDAAFFEDWSAWASLDDLPPRPRNARGEWVRWGARSSRPYSRYYCDLRLRIGWLDGPAFEVAIPPSIRIHDLVRAVPGARQDPRAWDSSRPAWRGLRDTWYVPAENWLALRMALPGIKAATKTWVASRWLHDEGRAQAGG